MIKIIKLDSINSTNTFAATEGQTQIARLQHGDRPELPFAVIADEQTEGRGRYGKSFYSPRGKGVYLSYVCEGNYALSELQQVTVVAAAIVHKVIQQHCSEALSIKWINDIYRGERKVAGILSERVDDPSGSGRYCIVIGVGVDVIPSEVPEELRQTVGWLQDMGSDEGSKEAAVRAGEIEVIASELVAALDAAFGEGRADDFPALIDYYRSYCYNLPLDFTDKLFNE